MPTFIVSTLETAPITLADEDLLVVTTSGSLWTTAAAVTTITNTQADLYLSIAGSVGSLFNSAIDLTAGVNRVDMTVAATGEIVALESAAVDIAVDFRANLANAGRITSSDEAVVISATDAAADLTLTNSGSLISTEVEALRMSVGTGIGTLINTGSISGGRDRDAVRFSGAAVGLFDVVNDGQIIATDGAEAINVDGGRLRLVNSGTILGNINAPFAFSVVSNYGLIDGDITFGTEGGRYTGNGGTLGGILFGGDGDTTITTDRDITVVELPGGGTDRYNTSQLRTDLAANIEFLTLLAGAVSGTGNAIANTIVGNGAANALGGSGGNDTISGREAHDEIAGGLGEDVLNGGDDDDTLWGNAEDDQLNGDDGADRLFGGSGNDVLRGGADDDTLFGGESNDTLGGGGGSDVYFGGAGADVLLGSSSDETLSGGIGSDSMTGGIGSDLLTGGAQGDRFIFTATTDSFGSAFDTIADFERTADKIDLSAIDANGNLAGNPTFEFIGTAAFTKAGQVRIVDQGSFVGVQVNTIGLSGSEMVILVTATTLAASDFIL